MNAAGSIRHATAVGRVPRATWIGAACLLASSAGLGIDRSVFAGAWLAAWWWCLGLVLGSQVVLWMHRLTGGRWGIALAPAAHAIGRRMPWLVPAFLPLVFMLPSLYPWAQDPQGWSQGMHEPGFARAWLSRGPFLARMAIYLALWCWLSRPVSAAKPGRAALSLALYLFSGSLAAVDLLASLVAGWSSSVFGLLVLTGQLLAGSAVVIVLTLWLRRARLPSPEPGAPPLGRDFGNLLLMGVGLWGYLSFMQFLVIWAENLPREISWFVPRLQTGWHAVGVTLVMLQLVLPTLALLLRSVKDDPRRLAACAAGVLAAQALDCVWMVLPSVDAHSLHGWWLAPLVIIGLGLCMFGTLPRALHDEGSEGP